MRATYGDVEPLANVFVGRQAELTEFENRLATVRSGRSQVVVVEGPAGVGKTAMVRHFLAQAADLEVLSASGSEWESRLPYGIVAQLLAEVEVPAPLAAIGVPDAVVPDPLAVGAQLMAVLADRAVPDPLAVVVDNLQWADLASLQALTFALRRFRRDAVMGVIIVRDALPVTADGIGRLADEQGVRLRLRGLDHRELAELAQRVSGSRLSQRAVDRLWDHTEGNPLDAIAVLDELGREAIEGGEGPLPAPRSFSMLTTARLASCGPEGRRLVEAAAVLGQRARLGSVARLAGITNPAAALDEAMTKQLLQPNPTSPGVVEFVHPLGRAAVYHHLPPARRAALHRAAAVTVDPRAALEHRIAGTLGEDDELAAEVEDHARREAARGALAQAGSYLLAAARLTGSVAHRERLTLDAADCLLDAGDVAGALRVVMATERYADQARACHVRGRLALFQGRPEEAERLLLEAWQHCDAAPEAGLSARISADMAQLCAVQLRAGDAAEWARRTIDRSEDAELTAAALGVLVPCLGMVGRSQEGVRVASGAIAQHRSADSVDVEGRLGRGIVRLWLDDLDPARTDLLAVVDACRNRPAARPALIALGTLGDVEYRTGAWDESLSHATRAVSLMEDSDQRWMATFLHSALTWALAPRGDWDRAATHVDAALAAARPGDPLSVFCAAAAQAHVAFFRGDYRLAAESLQPLFDRTQVDVPEEPGVHAWRHLHAEALLRLGRRADAEAAVLELERLADSPERRSTRAYANRLRALMDAARGDDQHARAGFEAAAAQFEALGMPFEAALAHDDCGRQLRRAGKRAAAVSHLQAALKTYRSLAADPLAAQAEKELAACGLRAGPAGRRPGALTPQELAVASLVGAGRTNRETAAELVISVKTVEHHLSAIYGKLGVRSRAELASAWPALGGGRVAAGSGSI